MGREIRRVSKDWDHPHNGYDIAGYCKFKPMYDESFTNAAKQFIAGFHAFYANPDRDKKWEYWEMHHVPDRDYYRPDWSADEMTHYQMYATISEGTPVSPVFETLQELEDYLVNHGDYWDQKRGDGGWSREAAKAFCSMGSAPSGRLSVNGFVTARDSEMYADLKPS